METFISRQNKNTKENLHTDYLSCRSWGWKDPECSLFLWDFKCFQLQWNHHNTIKRGFENTTAIMEQKRVGRNYSSAVLRQTRWKEPHPFSGHSRNLTSCKIGGTRKHSTKTQNSCQLTGAQRASLIVYLRSSASISVGGVSWLTHTSGFKHN